MLYVSYVQNLSSTNSKRRRKRCERMGFTVTDDKLFTLFDDQVVVVEMRKLKEHYDMASVCVF